jgi:DNA ligase-1
VQLSELVRTSEQISSTRSRTTKIAALAELLQRLTGDEIEIGVAVLSGQAPSGKAGIGPAALRAALETPPALEPRLHLADIAQQLGSIARLSGSGSAAQRSAGLARLFGSATRDEQEFLARLLTGELRQGALAGLLAEAVAVAAALPTESVRRAAMLAGDLPTAARAALTAGSTGLEQFRLQLFRPVQPMLAQPAETMEEALDQLGEAAFEYKIDGARIQVHKDHDEVRVYSRLGNDVTVAVPEVVTVARALAATTLVLDGEAIALRNDGSPLPFQTTMRRFGRRVDDERLRGEIPLTPFFFDVLHLDGSDLIDQPTQERLARLEETARGWTVPRSITGSLAAAEQFLAEALERGHEGIMAKSLTASYEAGRRGASWLKIKKAHSLDLVVLGAEWGHGRRRGWLSNLHLGARDPEHGGFVMLGKTFKGLTDELLAWQTDKLRQLEIGRDEWTVYVKPELVVEIVFNDVQESPHYPGGVALRFARVKRYRTDKTADETDSIATVRAILHASLKTET